MFTKTHLLLQLFHEYDIANLTHGIKEDKLGDLFEEYCVKILSSPSLLTKAKREPLLLNNPDEWLFGQIVNKAEIDIQQVVSMSATTKIPHLASGGNSKTDVILTVHTAVGEQKHTISVKQTTAAKVAMAEFDVETIVNEVGITDSIVKELMTKHQVDASAKNFTTTEKQTLTDRLAPFARSLVRWVLSGSPVESQDLRVPTILVRIQMTKTDEISAMNITSIDEQIDKIMLDKKGKVKSGGFGTGLSWTYATGSKGRKIQFKG